MLRNIYEFTKYLRIYETLTNLRNSYEFTKFLRILTHSYEPLRTQFTSRYEILRNFTKFTKLLRFYEILTNLRNLHEFTKFLRIITNTRPFYEFLTNLYESHRESNELKSVPVPRKCRKYFFNHFVPIKYSWNHWNFVNRSKRIRTTTK